MYDYKNLTVEKSNYIAIVTINRPEARNALDPTTWTEIRKAFYHLNFDSEVRTVIITGAGGKAFASGADIKSLQKRQAMDMLQSEASDILNEVSNSNKPVIAAIDGYALGGGCELAMACDIRIATKRSKLGQPEVGLGIIAGAGGTQRLQKLVGIGKAKQLLFTGEIIDAEEAKQIGLVEEVVEKDVLIAAKEMADKINKNGPVAVSLTKLAVNIGSNTDIHSGTKVERFLQTIAFTTEDRKEGTSAFIEKRKAKFNGK